MHTKNKKLNNQLPYPKAINHILNTWQNPSHQKDIIFNSSILVEKDDILKDTENESDFNIIPIEKPILKTRTRLNLIKNNQKRKETLEILANEETYLPLMQEFINQIKQLRFYNDALIYNSLNTPSFSNITKILDGYTLYNKSVQLVKELDEDIFIARNIKNSHIKYSKTFADTLIRLRILKEKSVSYQTENLQNLSDKEDKDFYFKRPAKRIHPDLPFGVPLSNTHQDTSSSLTETQSFKHCVISQLRPFTHDTHKQSFFISNLLNHAQNYTRTYLTSKEIPFILYSYDMYIRFEKDARETAKAFITSTTQENNTCSCYLKKLYAECFKPIFMQALKTKRIFLESAVYNAQFEEEKQQLALVISSWNNLTDCISKNEKKHKTSEWKNFIQATDIGNLKEMENHWYTFVKKYTPQEQTHIAYFEFIEAFYKKAYPLPFFPKKEMPLTKSCLDILIYNIKYIEFLHLRSLLKWVLKAVLVEFQTNVTMPMIKIGMKALYDSINPELALTEKNIFKIYQKTLDKEQYLSNLEIKNLKEKPAKISKEDLLKAEKAPDKDGNSALLLSIKADDFSLFKKLLKSGLNPNFGNKRGETTLILLAKLEKFSWIETLLNYNLKLTTKDLNNLTAIDYLEKLNQKSLIKKLHHKNTN